MENLQESIHGLVPEDLSGVVEQLLDATDNKLRETIVACSVPNWFNLEIVQTLQSIAGVEGDPTELLRGILDYAFVRPYHSLGFAYHEDVRSILEQIVETDVEQAISIHEGMRRFFEEKAKVAEEEEKSLYVREKGYHARKLGSLYLAYGDNELASATLSLAVESYEAVRDQRNLGRTFRILGRLYLNVDEVDQAESAYFEASKLAQDVGETELCEELLKEIGDELVQRRLWDRALDTYSRIEDKGALAALYAAQADHFRGSQELDAAEGAYLKSRNIYLRLGDLVKANKIDKAIGGLADERRRMCAQPAALSTELSDEALTQDQRQESIVHSSAKGETMQGTEDLTNSTTSDLRAGRDITEQIIDSPDLATLPRLRQILAKRFSEEGLRTLCFDLDIDYDDLPARGKAAKARELVAYLGRRDRIPDLVEWGRQHRPDIPWTDEESLPQRLGILIGFTTEDLEGARNAVQKAVDSPDTAGVRVEALGAQYGSRQQAERLIEQVCDVYLGILGREVGLELEDGSAAEAGFDAAYQAGKPILLYRKRFPVEELESRQKAFIERIEGLESGYVIRDFTDLDVPDQLEEWVQQDVKRLLEGELQERLPVPRTRPRQPSGKRVLIASLGRSPGTVTGLVHALDRTGTPIDRVRTVSTLDRNVKRAVRVVRDELKGQGMTDYEDVPIDCEEIVSDRDVTAFEKAFTDLLAQAWRAGDEVVIGVSGGRSIVGALLAMVAQVEAPPGSFFCQLCVPDAVEEDGRFPAFSRQTTQRKKEVLRPMHYYFDQCRLVKVPFTRSEPEME